MTSLNILKMIRHDKSLKITPSCFKQSNCKYLKAFNNLKKQLYLSDFNTIATIISKVRKYPLQFKNMRPRIVFYNNVIKLQYTKNNYLRIQLEKLNSRYRILRIDLSFKRMMSLQLQTTAIDDLVGIVSLGLNNLRIDDF